MGGHAESSNGYHHASSVFSALCRRARPLLVHVCDKERQNTSCPHHFCFVGLIVMYAMWSSRAGGVEVSCGAL